MLSLNLPVYNNEVPFLPGVKYGFPLSPYILEDFLHPSLLHTEQLSYL